MEYKIYMHLLKIDTIWHCLFAMSLCNPCCKVEHHVDRNTGTDNVMVECSHSGLTDIPDDVPHSAFELRLRSNRLITVPPYSFAHFHNLTTLDLSGNPIQELVKDSFSGLTSLRHLDLRKTEHHLQKSLPAEIFHSLPNLITLKLDNIFPEDSRNIPSSLFAHLETLTFLQLAVPRDFIFGEEFSHLRRLETLVVYGWNCNIGAITENTFAVFSGTRIRILEVRDCTVAQIESTALKHFSNLATLNLACNKEGSLTDFLDAVRQVPSVSLTTLILDGSSKRNQFLSFEPTLVEGKVFRQLTHLSLRSTKILKIEPEVFVELPNLQHLTFGYNIILFSPDKSFYNRTVRLLRSLKLRMLDISHFGEVVGGHNNFRELYCRDADRYSDEFFQKVPPFIELHQMQENTLKEVDYSHSDDHKAFLVDNFPSSFNVLFAQSLASRTSKLNGLSLSGDNNIVYMDFSFVHIKVFAKPVIGLFKLQGLNLGSCRIETIVPDALSYLPNLTYLNLTRNYLKNTNIEVLFEQLTSMKWLDISFNDLEIISNETFIKMKNLTSLVLKGNHISQIHFNISENRNLEVIDLSLCAIPYLEKHFTDQLERLHEQTSKTITLDLTGNMFECECPALHFIEWLGETGIEVTNKNHLECRYKDKNTTIISVDKNELRLKCSGWPSNEALITIAIGLISLSIIAVYVAFEYRWTLRWYYYKTRVYLYRKLRRLFNHNVKQETNTSTVFISYDQENDYEWTENVLLDWIEIQRPEIKTCLIARDFDAGLDFLEIVPQAVDRNQFTVIVLTATYEEFCFAEMRMAIEKGISHIIVIIKEKVELSAMSDTLRGLLTVAKCLEYEEEPDRLDIFWDELGTILRSAQSNM